MNVVKLRNMSTRRSPACRLTVLMQCEAMVNMGLVMIKNGNYVLTCDQSNLKFTSKMATTLHLPILGVYS
jgi:hypothetical protein